jgi:UDP-N-acetyl-D-mannosaminuronic acid dehydrogenase
MKITLGLAQKYVGQVVAIEPNVGCYPVELQNLNVLRVDVSEGLCSDVLILLVKHKCFKFIDPTLLQDKLIIDCSNVFQK